MVSGPAPGPAPAAQARASSSRLTASSWRTWPQRKLRRNVPSVDAAFTRKPSTRPVSPARRALAWSMWSPPASADITSVSSLSPTLARPGFAPRSRCSSTSSREAEVMGQRGRQDQARIGHQAVVIEGRVEAVEAVR